ncbi:MAG: hypothetical protein K8R48_01740 [Alphaproteobacteria bacterium]|nr:hypothetical protein [Alphaproteobacteria bacterium]
MNNLKKLLMVGLLATTAMGAGQALADPVESGIGTSTSSSGIEITIDIPKLINETGDAPLALGTWTDLTAGMSASEDLTVGVNYAGGAYKALLINTGAGAQNGYNVADGTGNFIAFTANMTDLTDPAGVAQDLIDKNYTTMTGAYDSLALGGQVANLNFKVMFAKDALEAAVAGSYSTTVTLTFIPV